MTWEIEMKKSGVTYIGKKEISQQKMKRDYWKTWFIVNMRDSTIFIFLCMIIYMVSKFVG